MPTVKELKEKFEKTVKPKEVKPVFTPEEQMAFAYGKLPGEKGGRRKTRRRKTRRRR
jgi:hypothetical protein